MTVDPHSDLSPRPRPEDVRRHADGEATPDEAARLSGAADRAVAFEQDLRQAVGRVMSEGAAPAGLADRIRAAMAEADSSDAIHIDDARDGLVAGAPAATTAEPAPVIETTPASRMSFMAWLESPSRANAAAVAAVLALVIGAIGFGVVMPNIQNWGGQQAGPSGAFVQTAATFAAREHGRCSGDDAAARKFTEFTSVDEAAAFLAQHLNRPADRIRIPDLSDRGYVFVGVSACRVPGDLPSVHALWRSIEPKADGMHHLVSGFVTLDREQFGVSEDGAAEMLVQDVTLGDGSTCTRTVRILRDGGLAFLIVCCDEQAMEESTARLARGISG